MLRNLKDTDILRRTWRLLLVGSASLVQALAIGWVFLRPGRPPVDTDAALFQHAGWYVKQGAVPYVNIWDPKPPLAIEMTTILAFLSQDNMLTLHLLSALVTGLAVVGSVWLIGVLIHILTGSEFASLAAGLVMLTFPVLYTLPAHGFRPKFFTIFFGLLAVYLKMQDRPFLSGVSAAMSAAFWLLGAIFAGLILGLAWQEHNRTQLTRMIGGMLLMTFLILLPIIAWGAFLPMLTEVILVPLLVPENQTPIQRIVGIIRTLGATSIAAMLAVYGLVRLGSEIRKRTWWVIAGGLWFAFQVLFVDFDGAADLLPGLVFVSLIVGLFAASRSTRTQHVIVVLLAVAVIANPFITRALRRPPRPKANSQTTAASHPNLPTMQEFFWNQIKPATCHYRLSPMEIGWLERTGRSYTEQECGRFPWFDGGQELPVN